jgi:hypothetical protein
MRKLLLVALTLGGIAAASLAAVVPALAGDGPLPSDVQEVRAAVAKYHSFEQAQRDGYSIEHEPCVSSPAGTMGIHAINRALLDDHPAIDVRKPEILLYVPRANGELELVGVEYMRIAADQNPSDGFDQSDKPSLFGRSFDGIMPGHAPWMGWHYDLHVWVAEENPSGLFALFNPGLSC